MAIKNDTNAPKSVLWWLPFLVDLAYCHCNMWMFHYLFWCFHKFRCEVWRHEVGHPAAVVRQKTLLLCALKWRQWYWWITCHITWYQWPMPDPDHSDHCDLYHDGTQLCIRCGRPRFNSRTRGHSATTKTDFWPSLTTYLPLVHELSK